MLKKLQGQPRDGVRREEGSDRRSDGRAKGSCAAAGDEGDGAVEEKAAV